MNLMQFFKESNGQNSSMRLFMLLVCFTTIFDWVFSLLTKGVWNPNPEVLMFILGVLGFKVWQKGTEKDGSNS